VFATSIRPSTRTYILLPIVLLTALLLSGCGVIQADLEYKAAQANASASFAQAMSERAQADSTKAEAYGQTQLEIERTQRLMTYLAYLASPAGCESQSYTCFWGIVALTVLLGGAIIILKLWSTGYRN
jgi:hypothetical protein